MKRTLTSLLLAATIVAQSPLAALSQTAPSPAPVATFAPIASPDPATDASPAPSPSPSATAIPPPSPAPAVHRTNGWVIAALVVAVAALVIAATNQCNHNPSSCSTDTNDDQDQQSGVRIRF